MSLIIKENNWEPAREEGERGGIFFFFFLILFLNILRVRLWSSDITGFI